MPRETVHRYRDPLDALWVETLRHIGLELGRTEHAYATTDGHGHLALATPAGLDPDDCIAQMALHELCHSLVQGPDSFDLPDWGLCNESERDVILEHACLRLQAALLAPRGLRRALAPTTDYRSYYDDLPDNPFQARSAPEQEAVLLARAGHARRTQKPWAPHLERALHATEELVAVARPLLASDHLLAAAELPPAKHPTGLLARFTKAEIDPPTCGTCAWARPRGKSPGALTCVPSGRRVASTETACAHHEAALDCTTCGACCREAYDTVEVAPRDPAAVHQALLVPRTGGYDLKRKDGRCIALGGGQLLDRRGRPPRSLPLYAPSSERFLCSIYEERPRTCRDFTQGSAHCLSARRAVGLSL